MTKWQMNSDRKKTGGALKRRGKKNRFQMGRDFLPAHIADRKVKRLRTLGGNEKAVVLSANIANVSVGGKIQKTKILSVLENSADSQFVRRNIITKGAVIETELGKAKVTSRPGQSGAVNAVLIEKASASHGKK